MQARSVIIAHFIRESRKSCSEKSSQKELEAVAKERSHRSKEKSQASTSHETDELVERQSSGENPASGKHPQYGKSVAKNKRKRSS